MTTHTFETSLAKGKLVEENFKDLIELTNLHYQDVRTEYKYRRLGIDFRIAVDDSLDSGYLNVDVKFDEASAKTGNIAVETVSVSKDGELKSQGWFSTSEADLFIYVVETKAAFVYTFFTKEELAKAIQQGTRKQVKNANYQSEVYVIPRKLLRGPTFTHLKGRDANVEAFIKTLNKAWGLVKSC